MSRWQLGVIAADRGHHDQAFAAFEEALAVFKKQGYLIGIALVLESAACLFATLGDGGRAMRLAGAALRLRETIKILPSPMERQELDRKLAPARRVLGAKADLAVAGGRATSLDEAVRLVVER
jgi:hypothetical protein